MLTAAEPGHEFMCSELRCCDGCRLFGRDDGRDWGRDGGRELVCGVARLLRLAVALCAGLIWFNFFRDQMIKNFFATMKQPPQVVTAAKVEAKTWTPGIGAIGTAKAANGVELAFETAGIVKDTAKTAGHAVSTVNIISQLASEVALGPGVRVVAALLGGQRMARVMLGKGQVASRYEERRRQQMEAGAGGQ